VTRFKTSVLQSSNSVSQVTSDDGDATDFSHNFTQFVADNVDHNVRTLDGNNIFHGMGIIAATTMLKVGTGCITAGHIQHLPRKKMSDLCQEVAVSIVPYHKKPGIGLETIKMSNIRFLKTTTLLPPVTNINILWHMYGVRPVADLRPNWSGYMQTVCSGTHAPLSTVNILPILDLKPTDLSCIYTTLLFVRDQAKKLNTVPSVTFDQPLYIKAVDICIAENLCVVCRLGGFHTLMNFLGAVGHVMKGSGLEEIMGLLYRTNTVGHVLSGKAFARSVKGHFIIHDALMQLLLLTVLKDRYEADRNQLFCADDVIAAVSHMYEQCWKDKVDVHDCSIIDSEVLTDVQQQLEDLKRSLASQSRTCRLWLQYTEHIDLVKFFILSERTSDWFLHLATSGNM